MLANKRLLSVLSALTLVVASADLGHAAPISFSSEAAWQTAVGSTASITFDSLFDGTLVTNQFAGLTFAALGAGATPRVTDQFSRSAPNSMIGVPAVGNGGGGFSATFASPVSGVGLWIFDLQFAGSTITLFDAANSPLGTFDLLATGGGHVATGFAWGFNGFQSSAGDIARVDVAITGTDFVTFDDVQFSSANTPTAVPEPATLTLMALGLAAASLRRRPSRRRA